jgi:intracellular multiplication protein IcmE
MFKFMVLLVAVFAVGIAAVSFFGGSDTNSDLVHLSKAPSFKEAPGGKTSPYLKEQTQMANDERSQQAIQSGGSAIPTPIGQNSDVGALDGGAKKDDPLNELRVETENLKKQVQQQQVQQKQIQQQQRPPEQFDNSLAEAMQRQMQQLLEGWSPKGIKDVTVIRAEDLKTEQKADQAAATAAAANAQQQQKKVVPAGTVSYAQLLTEANSDVPGPILAQIVSGPLTGARAIGSFQVANGYEKYLVLRFKIADKKGKDYQIDAYALDPDTTLGGMATEVDERYFARVILPAAAGFLQGMGQALSVGNSSIETNGSTTIATQAGNGYKQGIYNGLGTAAQTMGSFFQEQANLTKPLVRVAAGTPMGIFFVAPVYEPNENGTTTPINGVVPANGGYNNGYNGYNNGGYNPYGNNSAQGYNSGYGNGYPGTTVNGYGANSNLPYPNYASPGMTQNRTVLPTIGSPNYNVPPGFQ